MDHTTTVTVQVSLDDVGEIFYKMSHEQLFNFVKNIDLEVAQDAGYTETVAKWYADEMFRFFCSGNFGVEDVDCWQSFVDYVNNLDSKFKKEEQNANS